MKRMLVRFAGAAYRALGTRLFFLFDSEPIHEFVVRGGGALGALPGAAAVLGAALRVRHPSLETTLAGIRFENPVGLAAGFDYEARLPGIAPALGFGFMSVGTVTNGQYAGNPYPRMKRLVRSRSLLVNKGFKSSGMDAVLSRLRASRFDLPVGISIGMTNRNDYADHAEAIRDIAEAFEKAIRSDIPFAYLELNISCPNLNTPLTFYEPERLRALLTAVCAMQLSKPLFIKMPISLPDAEFLALVDVIRTFPVGAIIVGNLQHDRAHPAFDRAEIAQYEGLRGNWSGKPCETRSNELIALAYRHTSGALPIVGCGGIFDAKDAYAKIRAGASLVQLATGLVFEGPLLPAELCANFPALLQKDGFSSVTEAVGADHKI